MKKLLSFFLICLLTLVNISAATPKNVVKSKKTTTSTKRETVKPTAFGDTNISDKDLYGVWQANIVNESSKIMNLVIKLNEDKTAKMIRTHFIVERYGNTTFFDFTQEGTWEHKNGNIVFHWNAYTKEDKVEISPSLKNFEVLYPQLLANFKTITDIAPINLSNSTFVDKISNVKFSKVVINIDPEKDMAYVEGGSFIMGDNKDKDRSPAHKVTLTNDYLISKKQMSLSELPNFYNRWTRNEKFDKKLIEFLYFVTDRNFRLPTEAEWEYAIKGGQLLKLNTDDLKLGCDTIDLGGNHSTYNYLERNKLGLKIEDGYHPNDQLSEICSDYYGPYKDKDQINPIGDPNGGCPVGRTTGYFCDHLNTYNIYSRRYRVTRFSYRDVFRFVLDVTPEMKQKHEESKAFAQSKCDSIVNALLNDGMVYVKGGKFKMGPSTKDLKALAKEDCQKAHNVTLNSYYISKYEVSAALWWAVMGHEYERYDNKQLAQINQAKELVYKGLPTDTCVMRNITWKECNEFVNRLSELTGKKFRLPTEAEWEYAARGGYDNHQKGQVRCKKVNELNIFNLSDETFEWCEDVYDPHYYEKSTKNNPVCTNKTDMWGHIVNETDYKINRVIRGDIELLINRGFHINTQSTRKIGLRIVRELTDEEQAKESKK